MDTERRPPRGTRPHGGAAPPAPRRRIPLPPLPARTAGGPAGRGAPPGRSGSPGAEVLNELVDEIERDLVEREHEARPEPQSGPTPDYRRVVGCASAGANGR